MPEQFRVPVSWEDLPVGTIIHPSFLKGAYIDDLRWHGTVLGVLGRIVSQDEYFQRDRCKLVMLTKPLNGAWSLQRSLDAQQHLHPSFAGAVPSKKDNLFYWLGRPSGCRLYDPSYLAPEVRRGVFTCKCGAMNVDPSISAVFDNEYICYACRVILPRLRAA